MAIRRFSVTGMAFVGVLPLLVAGCADDLGTLAQAPDKPFLKAQTGPRLLPAGDQNFEVPATEPIVVPQPAAKQP